MADERSRFVDVRVEGDGVFSIPELKWRELLFVGALRADADDYVRDASRPLPSFDMRELFPEGARFSVAKNGGRIVIRRRT